MEALFVAVSGCVLAYLAAKNRGRSGWWWLLGWIGVVFVLVLPDLKGASEGPAPETHVRCPDCRELVRRDARKCKHCGAPLIPLPDGNGSQFATHEDRLKQIKNAIRAEDKELFQYMLETGMLKQHLLSAREYADLYQRSEFIQKIDDEIARIS